MSPRRRFTQINHDGYGCGLVRNDNSRISRRQAGISACLFFLKPDAILINVARGGIIDEAALYAHLLSHPGFRAGIDTWWVEPLRDEEFRTNYPFFSLPNVLGSPHTSAMVPGSDVAASGEAAKNVKRFPTGERISGVVHREDYFPSKSVAAEE